MPETLTLADRLEEKVRRYEGVTFVELMEVAGEEGKGTLSIEMPVNVVWWTGMSSVFIDALDELTKRKTIHPHVGHYLAYVIDGGALNLPLAKKPPKNGYKKPHWLPIVYYSGVRCVREGCPWSDDS